MDWHSRKVLSWRLSNTLDTQCCIKALKEASAKYGTPDIFNTDQGSQFTSFDFTRILKEHKSTISMDGKGRWMDNVFIERLWRSMKYECLYLNALEYLVTGTPAKTAHDLVCIHRNSALCFYHKLRCAIALKQQK